VDNRDLSYLGRPVILKRLSGGESKELILKRIRTKINPASTNSLFDDNSLYEISKEKEGIPSEVLSLARSCLIKASSMGIKQINKEVVEKVVSEEDSSDKNLWAVIKGNKLAERGYSKLGELRREIEFSELKKIVEDVRKVINREQIDDATYEILRLKNLVSLIPSSLDPAMKTYDVDNSVKGLFSELASANLLDEFVEWFTRQVYAEVISIPTVAEVGVRNQSLSMISEIESKIGRSDMQKNLGRGKAAFHSLIYNNQNEECTSLQFSNDLR